MKSIDVVVQDPAGMHARPAGAIAKAAKGFAGTVCTLTKDGKSVEMTRVFSLMGLGIKHGETVTISCDGAQEDEAIATLSKLFEV